MCDIPQDYIIAYFYENIDGTDTVRYANGGITVNGSKPYRIEKMFYESDYLKLRAELVAVNKLANDVARAAAMWEVAKLCDGASGTRYTCAEAIRALATAPPEFVCVSVDLLNALISEKGVEQHYLKMACELISAVRKS